MLVLPAGWSAAHRRRVLAGLGEPPPGSWLVTLTSGSTGAPRAVARTRASWQSSVAAFADLAGIHAEARVLAPGPLSSSLFLHATWHAAQVGAALVPVDHPRRPVEDLALAQPWDVAHLTPLQLADLLRAAEARRVGGDLLGRGVVVAGAALPAPVAEQAASMGLRVLHYYGAAELSFVAAGPPGALRAFPGVQVQARDGVLWARGPGLCLGYLGASEASAGPLRRDARGWASVGDIGALTPDGTIQVGGRGATTVTTGAATVLVSDVEAVLDEMPGLRACAVLGRPHPDLGAVLVAAVQPEPSSHPRIEPISAASLRAFAADRLAGPQRPRRWYLVPELPRTTSGKIDRAAVEALLDEASPLP